MVIAPGPETESGVSRWVGEQIVLKALMRFDYFYLTSNNVEVQSFQGINQAMT